MSVDSISLAGLINPTSAQILFKIGFVLFAIVYFIFSLIVIRQVNLMIESLQTEAAPILRFLAILHALVSLGIVVFFIVLL